MATRRTILLLASLVGVACTAYGQSIFSIAGVPYGHRKAVDGQPALSVPLNFVYGLLFDHATGRLLFHDGTLVERVEPDGSLLALVGRGEPQDGTTADGALASNLQIAVLRGMAQDAAGNLYLADAGAGRVYRVAQDGRVSTFAGGGTKSGLQSDGGPATAAQLLSPRGMVFDSKGNLDIAETFCDCIRQVSPAGIISTVYTLPGSPGAGLREVEGLGIDAQDNLYLTEWLGHTVLRIGANGSVTTIAGTGVAGFSGDGGPATAAQLYGPSAVATASDGTIYIADSGNNRVRKVAPDGTISTIAGTGSGIGNILLPPSFQNCAFSGDGGLATSAQLCNPAQLAFDKAGGLYVADFGSARVRRISPEGIIATVAGSGQPVPVGLTGGAISYSPADPFSTGDGGPAIHATFDRIGGAIFDAAGNLYVSNSGGNRVRKIASDGTIGTYAGTGQAGYSGDGGPASEATLFGAGPLALDPSGGLYVITGDSRVRRITADGTIHLVAGTGTGVGLNRAQGDGGPAVNATLNEPGGVAFDAKGNIYIADTSNARLRKIDTSGIITTIVGPGQQGTDYYNAVAVDPQGNIFLAWTHAALYPAVATNAISGMILRVNPDGSLSRVVGNGQPCTAGPAGTQFAFDGTPAIEAQLCEVRSMMIDKNGVMYLPYGSQILRVTTDGIIHTVAGNSLATAIGDGGPALEAGLNAGQGAPGTPTFDSDGNMVIPQTGIDRVREVTATPYKLSLSLGSIGSTGSQPQTWRIATSANFLEPFPYAVRVSTDDGGSWLSVNRLTGLVGEPITVSVNPAGLGPGSYHGTVSVTAEGGVSQQVNVPVTLAVPSP
jgi:sugar lactone lactonase YvrE